MFKLQSIHQMKTPTCSSHHHLLPSRQEARERYAYWYGGLDQVVKELVLESPIPGLEKDQDWTRPDRKKDRTVVLVFQFLKSKTAQRPIHMDWSELV